MTPTTTDDDLKPEEDYDETEDEEVKLNCIAGVRDTFHDSDLDSPSIQGDAVDDGDDDETM